MSSYAPWLPQTPNERRMVAVAILALLGLFAADAVAAPGHARMAVLAMVLALLWRRQSALRRGGATSYNDHSVNLG